MEDNVTDWGAQLCLIATCPITYIACVPGVIGRKTIRFDKQGVTYTSKCLGLWDKEKHVPATDLASTERTQCLCCVGISSKLTNRMPLFIGNGMQSERVNALIRKIRDNYTQRGEIKMRELTMENNQLLKRLVQHLIAPRVHHMSR